MRTASPALRTLIESGEFLYAELYTITLVSGAVLRYTSADRPISWGGHLFPVLSIARDRTKLALGLSVDETTVTMSPQATDTVQGTPFGQAVRAGVLDGAQILVQEAFLSDWSQPPVGVLHCFQGSASDADGGRSEFRLTVKSALELLNIDMPRNLYQGNCNHIVYDSGCTLLRSAFTVSGVITSAPTQNSFVASGLSQATGWFDQGVVALTSGADIFARRTVRTHLSGGSVSFVLPLGFVPAIGDTFSIYPGCDRTQPTCGGKFANLAHFKGYPYIPTPETAI